MCGLFLPCLFIFHLKLLVCIPLLKPWEIPYHPQLPFVYVGGIRGVIEESLLFALPPTEPSVLSDSSSSTTTKASLWPPCPESGGPDNGLKAWLLVRSRFCPFINTRLLSCPRFSLVTNHSSWTLVFFGGIRIPSWKLLLGG